jgi:hypothetical protein
VLAIEQLVLVVVHELVSREPTSRDDPLPELGGDVGEQIFDHGDRRNPRLLRRGRTRLADPGVERVDTRPPRARVDLRRVCAELAEQRPKRLAVGTARLISAMLVADVRLEHASCLGRLAARGQDRQAIHIGLDREQKLDLRAHEVLAREAAVEYAAHIENVLRTNTMH